HRQYITRSKDLRPTPFTSRRYLSVYNVFGFRIAELASRIMNPPRQSIH
ncbi:MAG: hypothetical protein JNL88_10135, partial [Bacteroidia bacterium]|nr:hypothetical protein [Bacteroidia bacterium]